MTNPRDQIEQAARRSANEGTAISPRFHVAESEAVVSVAISLKRIADALHGAGENGISLTAAIADIADRRGH